MSVVNNSSISKSALNKRRHSIFYHRVREAQAAGIIRFRWISGEFNLEDLFTKTIMPGNKIHNLVDSIFSNTSLSIGDIDKAYVHLYMGAYRYLPHYNISRVRWFLGFQIYILFKSIIYGYQFAGTR